MTDIADDNCVVNWTPPVDDDGGEVAKYIVEVLDNSSATNQWKQISTSNSNADRSSKIEGLNAKLTYKFRVLATNQFGESAPCDMMGKDVIFKKRLSKQ